MRGKGFSFLEIFCFLPERSPDGVKEDAGQPMGAPRISKRSIENFLHFGYDGDNE